MMIAVVMTVWQVLDNPSWSEYPEFEAATLTNNSRFEVRL